jgi:hypothetical protein
MFFLLLNTIKIKKVYSHNLLFCINHPKYLN